MLPFSILRKAYRRMFDENIQDEFTYLGVMNNGKVVNSVDYDKAWEACLIEVCSKCISDNVKIAAKNRNIKMAAKIKNLRENGIEI
jgi:hypothetical protein